MKTVTKKIGLFALAMSLSLIIPTVVFSQPPLDDPDAPIDGGLSLILAAGGILGAKKIRDNRKKKNTVEL
jgi:hypothetical protein